MKTLLILVVLILLGCTTGNTFGSQREKRTLHVLNHSWSLVTVYAMGRRVGDCESQRSCRMSLAPMMAQITSSGRLIVGYRELGWPRAQVRMLGAPWGDVDWTLDVGARPAMSWLAPARVVR